MGCDVRHRAGVAEEESLNPYAERNTTSVLYGFANTRWAGGLHWQKKKYRTISTAKEGI